MAFYVGPKMKKGGLVIVPHVVLDVCCLPGECIILGDASFFPARTVLRVEHICELSAANILDSHKNKSFNLDGRSG